MNRYGLFFIILLTFPLKNLTCQSVDFETLESTRMGCDSITLNFNPLNLPSGADTSYQWTFRGGNTNLTSSLSNPEITFNTPDTISVELLVNNSFLARKRNYVVVFGKPNAGILRKDTLPEQKYTKVFANRIQKFENLYTYNRTWNIEQNTYSTRRVVHQFADTGRYTLKLNVQVDELPDCQSDTSSPLFIREDLFLANVFVPEIQTAYIVRYNSETLINFNLYSRYGNLVYKSSSPTIVWDGKTNSGNDVTPGVYYYVVTTDDGLHEQKGFLHLYRK